MESNSIKKERDGKTKEQSIKEQLVEKERRDQKPGKGDATKVAGKMSAFRQRSNRMGEKDGGHAYPCERRGLQTSLPGGVDGASREHV